MKAARHARIVRVERPAARQEAWLDIVFDEPQREQIRITLLDAPGYIDSCADFISVGGKRWAKRLNYTLARLCAP